MRTYTAGSQVKSSDLNLLIQNKRSRFPAPIIATNWATNATFNGWVGTPGLQSSGAGDAFVDLDVPEGYRLASLTLLCLGDAAADLTIGIDKAFTSDAQNVSLGSLLTSAVPAAPADITLNMLATMTGQVTTITTAAPLCTYTRAAGSFIDDGFFVGQIVQCSGFANGANNNTATITALSATVMTTDAAATVAETANATIAGVSPVVDGTFALQLKLTASATALQVRGLRYTCCPI